MMPQAVPLPRGNYVQYMRVEPDAPRRAPARTVEVKGRKRVGDGQAFRLFGQHAVVVGRWSQETVDQRIQQARETYRAQQAAMGASEPSDDGWGRLIRPDEFDYLADQFAQEKIREGWNPPVWHWRFYWEHLLNVLNNIGLVRVSAYNYQRLTFRWFLRRLYDALKVRLFVREEPEYVPFQVGDDEEAVS